MTTLSAYEEFLREKRAIDAVVARIEEEETAAEIARLEKQRETKGTPADIATLW